MADRPHQRQPSASQRSMQGEESLMAGSSNAFGDDFYLEAFGVADGYQPSSQPQYTTSGPRTSSRKSTHSQPASSPYLEAQKKKIPLQGNAQGLGPRNSFSLRHDAQNSDPPRRTISISSTSAQTEASTMRPYSTVSRLSIPRPPSTYIGASAPSHPYGMYPQTMTSLNRQSSNSTARPAADRSSVGADVPMHPYGMYPQTTVPGMENESLEPSGDIASVGFPGLRQQQYARRLGPDGEEADDILGPDGHTEQLPPYTRFPSAGPLPTKGRYVPVLQPIAAPRSPELPQTANSASSMSDALLANNASHEYSQDAVVNQPNPQDQSTKERWTDKSKQKTCFGRLPRWAVALMIFLLVIMAALAGALIGRFVHPPHMGPPPPGPDDDDSQPAMNPSATIPVIASTIYDAAPLTVTPTGLPPVQTGAFSLMLAEPHQSSGSCISSFQSLAWGCAGSNGVATVDFSVTNPMYSAAQIQIADTSQGQSLYYGGQPPNISVAVNAPLVNDTTNPELGPALFFFTDYDKLVLVRYNDLNNATSPTKRSMSPSPEEWASLEKRGGGDSTKVHPGEPLWVCYWNTTTLEGFVYVNSTTANNKTLFVSSTTPMTLPTPTNPPKKSMDKRHENKNHGMSRNHNNGMPPSQTYPTIVKLKERRDPVKVAGNPPYCVAMQMDNNNQLVPPLVVPPAKFDLTEIDSTDSRAIFMDKRDNVNPRDGGICTCEWLT